jgi:hypothetical protein
MRDTRLEIFEELADHTDSLEEVLARMCEMVRGLQWSINEQERLDAACRLVDFVDQVEPLLGINKQRVAPEQE